MPTGMDACGGHTRPEVSQDILSCIYVHTPTHIYLDRRLWPSSFYLLGGVPSPVCPVCSVCSKGQGVDADAIGEFHRNTRR